MAMDRAGLGWVRRSKLIGEERHGVGSVTATKGGRRVVGRRRFVVVTGGGGRGLGAVAKGGWLRVALVEGRGVSVHACARQVRGRVNDSLFLGFLFFSLFV